MFFALASGAISIEGGSPEIANTVRGYLTPELEHCDGDNTPEISTLQRQVRRALDALGYYQATIKLNWVESCKLSVNIEPFTLSEIELWEIDLEEPNLLVPQDRSWLEQSKRTGLFEPAQYEQNKRKTLSGLKDRGYLDAEFATSEVRITAHNNAARVRWLIDSGPRYSVRTIVVDQSVLQDELFNRYLKIEEGKPLRKQDVVNSYENLIASDYFSSVRVTPLTDTAVNGEIDVRVSAKKTDPWSVLSGVGFATDSGPRLRAEANARYLNSRGHRLGTSALISPVLGNATAEYRWPYGDPTHQWYSLEVKYAYEDTDTAESDAFNIGLRRVSRIAPRWTQTLYTDFLDERFDIADQEGRSQLWLIGTNLSYTSTIDTARPRHGRRLSVDLRGADSTLFSDNDLIQARVQAKQILPFFGKSRWIFRAEVGATWRTDFSELPTSLRFFAGGDKSVRGFGLDELGPKDADGDVIGGDRLLAGSAEFDFPVRENWSVALFTDAGSAYTDKPEFSYSVGVGVRWYSPLGPVRADLAHPMNDSSRTVRLHISIGPDI